MVVRPVTDRRLEMRVAEPREAPEPKTADEITADADQRRVQRRDGVAALLFLLGIVASHALAHLSPYGAWALLALIVAGLVFSVVRQGVRGLASPIRGIFLLWLAISVAAVVLVSLDSFSAENLLLLAVVWGVLLVLWLGDRGLARLVKNTPEPEQPRSSPDPRS
jgi:hypothetical protein